MPSSSSNPPDRDGSEVAPPIPDQLPRPAVGRLCLYFRELHRLNDGSLRHVSSRDIASLVDVSADLVRRDLADIGARGRRGVGYEVSALTDRIGRVLGGGRSWSVALVGVGSLGQALLKYRGFERLGFRLTVAVDRDPERIGQRIGSIRVTDERGLEDALQRHPADLAILAVPASAAADVAARLVAAELRGILNFAPVTLKLPADVAVVNVDLASEMQRLVFSVRRGENANTTPRR